MLTARTFAAELHPDNRAAKTVMEKIRITGLVVLVTSLAGLVGLVLGSTLVAAGTIAPGLVVPTLAQLVHGPTLALAALAGVFVLTALAYFSYSCVVKITAENLIAMTGLQPITTLLMQEAAGRLKLIPHFEIDATLLVGMVVVAIGVLIMVAGARQAQR
jgi:Ca2+/Na+ antiporter